MNRYEVTLDPQAIERNESVEIHSVEKVNGVWYCSLTLTTHRGQFPLSFRWDPVAQMVYHIRSESTGAVRPNTAYLTARNAAKDLFRMYARD